MAALDFTPRNPRRATKSFNTQPFRQFQDCQFGVYYSDWNDDGECVKEVGRNPYTGHMFSPNRLDTGLSLEEAGQLIDTAISAGETRKPGLILYMPSDLVCVDFDGTESPETDIEVKAAHYEVLESSATWIERSVSEVGYHAFYRLQPSEAEQLTNTNNKDKQIDTRVVNGFVFLTGDTINDSPIAPFETVESNFKSYLYRRCQLSLEAAKGSNAAWVGDATHSDMEVLTHLFMKYPESAKFLNTRGDQTGLSDFHYRAVCDLIRCSLNFEQVKRMYIASPAAEYAYRSEKKAKASAGTYERWLLRNIHGAAADLTASGRFFNPDEVFVDLDGATEEEYETAWTDDVTEYTSTDWIVQGVIPSKGVVSVYGPSGSGKTFLVIDMASCIARGVDFFGKRTKRVPVTYVGLEGEAGLKNRVYAYRKHHGDFGTVMMITSKMNILESHDQQRLLRTMVRNSMIGGLLIVDTMAKSAPGMNENDSSEMSRYIAAVEDLARETNSCVLLVHHSGKDTERGPRGHSSFLAGIDAAVEVKRDPSNPLNRSWGTKKVKDGDDDLEFPFVLEAIEIGQDQWGQPAFSCVISPGPSIDELIESTGVTQDDAELLASIMNASMCEFFGIAKGRGSVYHLLREMTSWPEHWDDEMTGGIIAKGIQLGILETYSVTDPATGRVKEGVQTCI